PGTYSEYLQRCGDDHLDGEAVVLKAKRERQESAATAIGSAATAESWEDQKRRRNRQAQLPKLRDKALADIELAEARKREIQAMLFDPALYQRGNDAIMALQAEDAALDQRIATLM